MNIQAICNNIRRIRKGFGLSQEKFAKKLHISQSYVSALELNKSEPTLNILFAIHRKFDIPLEELFGDDNWN